MAYVDLNPVRAGIAATPEESEFTSIYERVRRAVGPRSSTDRKEEGDALAQVPLRPFHSAEKGGETIPYRFEDYLALVDWTGRQIREDKRGHIDVQLPPIIQRLNIDHDAWCLAMRPRGNVFGRAMGKLNHLRLHAQHAWSVLGERRANGGATLRRSRLVDLLGIAILHFHPVAVPAGTFSAIWVRAARAFAGSEPYPIRWMSIGLDLEKTVQSICTLARASSLSQVDACPRVAATHCNVLVHEAPSNDIGC